MQWHDTVAPPAPEGFLDWMRNEPVSTFSAKVAAISGVELTLTSVWLHLLLHGPVDLPDVVSLFMR